MSNTPNLSMPLLASNQSGKEVTHNEALVIIDALLNNGIIDKDLTTPPGTPNDGDSYIVGSSATGDWATHDNSIAFYNNGWRFITPNEGLTFWVNDENCLYTYGGTNWVKTNSENLSLDDLSDVAVSSASQYQILAHNGSNFINTKTIQNLDLVGVNTSADSSNKLAVASDYILFDKAATDIRIKANKNDSADTASHLFQDNYSGRAEFGLIGNDDFTLKVSSNGSSWNNSFVVDKSTGDIDFKAGLTKNGDDVGVLKTNEITVDNDSNITFTNLDDGYHHKFVLDAIKVATNNVDLKIYFSDDNGSTWETGLLQYKLIGGLCSGSAVSSRYAKDVDYIIINNEDGNGSKIGNETGECLWAEVVLYNPNNTSTYKAIKIESCFNINGSSDDTSVSSVGSGQYKSTSKYNAIKFELSSGNITSGVIKHYKF